MLSAALSTLLVLSVYCNQAVLGQAANATTAAGSSAGGSSSSVTPATGGSSSALSLAAGLSPGCQAAAGGLLTSEFGSCSNIMGLVSVIGASGSILTPLTTWISGICSASPCSNDTLKQATQTVSSGCSADIQKGSGIAVALLAIVSNYAGARDLLCTQYASNSTFCLPSILENVQTASGKNITVTELSSMLAGGMSPSGQAFANVPSSTYCTDCGHAIVTESSLFLAGSSASGMTNGTSAGAMSSISSTCGASFTDGKIPSTVRIAGKNSAKPNSSAGALRLPAALAVAPPVALATLFLASLI